MKDEENNLMNLETILLTNMATIYFILLLSFVLSKADDDLQWEKKKGYNLVAEVSRESQRVAVKRMKKNKENIWIPRNCRSPWRRRRNDELHTFTYPVLNNSKTKQPFK